jgi:hypothetical protein
VALLPQPVDRVHPHVARIHTRRLAWPSTSSWCALAPSAGPAGRTATRLLRAPSGPRTGAVSGASTDAPSDLVALDADLARQRVQHRCSHPTTEHIRLGV